MAARRGSTRRSRCGCRQGGNKVRMCPIWPRTAQLLHELVLPARRAGRRIRRARLFVNQRGEPLVVRRALPAAQVRDTLGSRHGPVARDAAPACAQAYDRGSPSEGRRRLRNDQPVVGPRQSETTMRYARSDLDLKRQALSQVFPDILAPREKAHVPSTRWPVALAATAVSNVG